MKFKFRYVFQYADEAFDFVTAIASYFDHRDESVLADNLTEVILDVAKQLSGGDPHAKIDEEALRRHLVGAVDAIEPLFGPDKP